MVPGPQSRKKKLELAHRVPKLRAHGLMPGQIKRRLRKRTRKKSE